MTPADGTSVAVDTTLSTLRERIMPMLREKMPPEKARWIPRAEVAREAKQMAADYLTKGHIELNLLDQRDLVTSLVNTFLAEHQPAAPPPVAPASGDAPASIPIRSVLPGAPETANVTLDALISAPRENFARNPSRASV